MWLYLYSGWTVCNNDLFGGLFRFKPRNAMR